MASRTGIVSIYSTAREMCRLIQKFNPVLQVAFADHPALLAALAAASAACDVLESEIVNASTPGD